MTDASSAEEEGITKIAAIAQAKERIDAHLRQEAKPRPELSSEVISRSTLSWANKQFALLPSSRRLFKAVKATKQESVNMPPFTIIPTLHARQPKVRSPNKFPLTIFLDCVYFGKV